MKKKYSPDFHLHQLTAQKIINSNERAEEFIERWIREKLGTRETAIKRLRKLGVPAIIIEKNARAGDSWRNRYKSLCLHDPVWYDHLPYMPFPEDWPIFAPKDKIGDWLEMYTKVMELNYWNSTTCKKAHYNEARGEWEITTDQAVSGSRTLTLPLEE